MRHRFFGLTIAICVLVFLTASAYGQEVTAGVFGVVQDGSGAVIPGATIHLRNLATGRPVDELHAEAAKSYALGRIATPEDVADLVCFLVSARASFLTGICITVDGGSTRGVYACMRHPIYLAILAMLLATGLLASAGQRLLVAVVIYLAGSELRIASEEEYLARTFRAEYEQYRLRTRWRYLPGLR